MTKAYLGAPMREVPQHNYPNLFRGEEFLLSMGYEVTSPARNEQEQVGLENYTEKELPGLMQWDLTEVINADVIVFLEGWDKSEGCLIERSLAHMLDKPVFFLDLESLTLTEEKVGDARFHTLLREMGTLHDRKQTDYGTSEDAFANVRASEDFGIPAWVGCLMRLNDKVTRLQNFAQKGSLANESAEDSMLDIAVYAIIALVLYREASGELA